uniref:t-SNARE coiled-coil homology domain-containing protein n=1 Tax=Entomoneis paludosa TaxID=265537 RepID=A0A7S2YP29_9STRA|mmetsp:Transcript_40780/g.84853  ORF Transcript_40780/g.84853 Transcript_40780/m.84853 type:complete len:177 (+) Transcript_40780:493-1023(+)
MRENMSRMITQQFKDCVEKYQEAQQSYKQEMKRNVTRQIKIVKPNATEDEIAHAMKTENGVAKLYQKQVLCGSAVASIEVQNRLHHVHERQHDIAILEHSVSELHQMFLDFAFLTEQQGTLLDQIEYNVAQANDVIKESNLIIHEAFWLQKLIRKKQCWVVAIVAIVAIIFLLLLL